MTPRAALRAAGQAALDTLLTLALSPTCAACEQPLEHPSAGSVCEACWSSIRTLRPPFCGRCGDPLASWRTFDGGADRCARCRRIATVLGGGRAAGEYEGALRAIIHAFKYEGRRTLAVPLGRLMCKAGTDVLAGAQCAVPVPLHPWRRLRRGFNQATDLASTTGLPVVAALWRTRATQSQTGLTAAARRRNVRDAFRLSPLLAPRAFGLHVVDRIVVLVDDVRTTGATLDACARVLKQAGAREVRALTVARASIHERR
jgi:ComF family protein